MRQVQPHDLLLLLTEEGQHYLLELEPGGEFQSPGGQVVTDRGRWIALLQPSTSDLIMHLRWRTQIGYPKEVGHLLLWIDVLPGKRVIEAGTGSGAMTVALARHVQPARRVYSYKVRERFQEVAWRNLECRALLDWGELKVRDIAQRFDEREVEALFLDVRERWEYLKQAQAQLKGVASSAA